MQKEIESTVPLKKEEMLNLLANSYLTRTPSDGFLFAKNVLNEGYFLMRTV